MVSIREKREAGANTDIMSGDTYYQTMPLLGKDPSK
jgi:hypothetical protein